MVESMLDPTTLAAIGGTLIVWLGSHAFGIGEFVDLVLLGAGIATLGFSAFEGAKTLYDFAAGAVSAKSDSDLERAGQQFARAVLILGASTVQAILLHGQARAALAKGAPKLHPLSEAGPVPPAGNKLRITRPESLPGTTYGATTAYGEISIARNYPIRRQQLTLLHELVHRYFSPRTGPLRRLRGELAISAYSRLALMRYLEEALAEGYSRLRMNGLASALGAFRFPITNGYVTISELTSEGTILGSIILGGVSFKVSFSLRPLPGN